METNKITGNEPAMPTTDHNHSYESKAPYGTGLTIRQQFAMVAMQGILSANHGRPISFDDITRSSCQLADALINELNK